MPSITNTDISSITATFNNLQKDANGNVTINATFKNNGGLPTANVHLSISTTNSAPWKRIDVGTLAAGATASGSVTIPTGSTGSSTVYIYLLVGSYTSGPGSGYTAAGYVDPNPFSKKKLTITPSEAFMGDSINISETSGQGVSSVTREWSVGGHTGSFATGSWTIPKAIFEPLARNTTFLNVVFTTYSSGSGGRESSSQTVKIKVPSNYMPTAEHTYDFIDSRNNALIAGLSKIKIGLLPSLVPSDNTATIESVSLLSVNTTNPALTKEMFMQSGNDYTSMVLPNMSGVPSYVFSLTFRIIDSRGNVLDYTTNQFRVTNFVPPYVEITNLKRNTATTGRLNVSISSPSAKYAATVKIGDDEPINVLNDLVQTSDGYTLDFEIVGLVSGNQYNVVFSYQDTNMHDFGELPYTYTQLLSTMAMPLSLYDDGSKIVVSVGEECADEYQDVLSDILFNLAQGAEIRATNELGTSIVHTAYELLNSPTMIAYIIESILGNLKLQALTPEEYAELVEEGLIDEDTLYFVYGVQ